jgi:hypothetical protein
MATRYYTEDHGEIMESDGKVWQRVGQAQVFPNASLKVADDTDIQPFSYSVADINSKTDYTKEERAVSRYIYHYTIGPVTSTKVFWFVVPAHGIIRYWGRVEPKLYINGVLAVAAYGGTDSEANALPFAVMPGDIIEFEAVGSNETGNIAFLPYVYPILTSYDNPQASGDRTGGIVVTTTAPYTGDIEAALIGPGVGDTSHFNSVGDVAGLTITFDFLTARIVQAMRIYRAADFDYGYWKPQGSNNGVDWDDLAGSQHWSLNPTYIHCYSTDYLVYLEVFHKHSNTVLTSRLILEYKLELIIKSSVDNSTLLIYKVKIWHLE